MNSPKWQTRSGIKGAGRLLLILAVGGGLTGCESGVGGAGTSHELPAPSAVVSSERVELTAEEIARALDAVPQNIYRLGPNDVISIEVYLHPELSVPSLAGSGGASALGGAMITSDGTVQLPMIGAIHLGGLSLADGQAAITEAYKKYIVSPKVAVTLVQAQSLRYYLLGQFSAPGVKYPVHQLTILEALALGGTVDIAGSDLYQAYVARGTLKLPVNLHALLVEGDLSQNIKLASGDAIVVPPASNENAFVLGAVGRPGAVAFESGRLSLLQALSSAGLDLTNYTNAHLSDVRVIRSEGTRGQFMVVDAEKILEGKAAAFPLRPGDIIFVSPTAVATWNQVMTQLVPSLQAVSSTLTPFVDLKYLTKK